MNPLTLKVDPNWIHPDFWALIPLAEKWGIGDDSYRGIAVDRAPVNELKHLYDVVYSHEPWFGYWLAEISGESDWWQKDLESFEVTTCLVQAFELAESYLMKYEKIPSLYMDRAPFDSSKIPEILRCLTPHATRFGFEYGEVDEIIIARLFPHERHELIHCANRVRGEVERFVADRDTDPEVADEVAAFRNLLLSIDFARRWEAGEAGP